MTRRTGDTDPESWLRDEAPILLLPDITLHEMDLLLALLYHGSVNIYRSELPRIVSLTHLLKLVSIPVALSEESWTERCAPPSHPSVAAGVQSKAVITFVAPVRGIEGGPRTANRVAAPPLGRPATAVLSSARSAPPNILLSGSSSAVTSSAVLNRFKTPASGQSEVFVIEPNNAAGRPKLLSYGDNITEFEADGAYMMIHPADGDDVDDGVDDDGSGQNDERDLGGGGAESEIEEIEIFLNGDGEVERMEVCQSMQVEDEVIEDDDDKTDVTSYYEDSAEGGSLPVPEELNGTAAMDSSSAKLSQLLCKRNLSVARGDAMAGRDSGFLTDLGELKEEKDFFLFAIPVLFRCRLCTLSLFSFVCKVRCLNFCTPGFSTVPVVL